MEKEAHSKLSSLAEDILTVLGERTFYGLEILDRINQGRPVPIEFSSLYPALNRLTKKQFVEWRYGDDDETTGGGRRKYYCVTEFGVEALKAVQDYRENLKKLEANS